MNQENGSNEVHHHYRDADGTTLYSVAKLPGKNFRRYRDENGTRVWNWQGVEQVPYNLVNVFGKKTVPDKLLYAI